MSTEPVVPELGQSAPTSRGKAGPRGLGVCLTDPRPTDDSMPSAFRASRITCTSLSLPDYVHVETLRPMRALRQLSDQRGLQSSGSGPLPCVMPSSDPGPRSGLAGPLTLHNGRTHALQKPNLSPHRTRTSTSATAASLPNGHT